MANSKPTFVIVPRGWHSIPQFRVLIGHLEAAGHPVQTTSLPSLNPGKPSTTDCYTDAEAIRSHLLAPIEADGKDIVLICHSYDGIPGGGAARTLSRSARAKEARRAGGIGLFDISAFAVPEG